MTIFTRDSEPNYFVELHANGDGSKMGKSTFKVCFPTPYMIKLNRYGELNAATCPNC